jgi:hypothetical protein
VSAGTSMMGGHVSAVRLLPHPHVFSWLRLAGREESWKDAEILLLRHQLGVLQRQQVRKPGLTWADRALIAALTSVVPKARRAGLRLLVTPDTVMRWHRDLLRRRWAAKSRAGRSGRLPPDATSVVWSFAWQGRTRRGDIGESMENSPALASGSRPRPCGRSSPRPESTPHRDGPDRPGHSSCALKPKRSSPTTSSPSTCSTVPRHPILLWCQAAAGSRVVKAADSS